MTGGDEPWAAALRPIRILLVDDNPIDAELIVYELRRASLHIETTLVSDERSFRRALDEFRPDVVLCDFSFPAFDGAAALAIVRAEAPATPLIFVSGTLTEDRLSLVVENGAADYVLKSNPLRLPGAVRRAVERAGKLRALRAAETRVARLSAIRDFMSAINAAIVRLHDRAALFAEACRIATSAGTFPFAAIITRREPGAPLCVEASAGVAATGIVASWLGTLPGDLARGAGTVGVAFSERAPAVLADMSDDLSIVPRDDLWQLGLRSEGSFPLVVGNQTVGVLMICAAATDFFNEEEIALLSDVASNLAFALEFIAEQQRVNRLSRIRDVLSAVPEAIVRVVDGDRLVEEVCRIAYETAGYVNVFAVARDAERERLRIASAAGACAGELPALRARASGAGGIVLAALRDGQPHVDDRTDGTGIGASAAFPLVVGDQTWGALVFDAAVSGSFDDEELQLLTNLSNNLALALDHREREKRLQRLRRIRDVLSAVNAAIVRLRDGDELCREACRIAVASGGFVNAFVADVDLRLRRLSLRSFLGRSERGSVEAVLARRLADPRRDPGIIELSVCTKRPAVKRVSTAEDPGDGWAGRDGLRAAGSFPIVIDGECNTAIVFETDTADYFDAEGIELLTNLTNNVAFGLSFLEKQRRVDYLSYYDTLTDLPNRTLFYDRLGHDIAASGKAGKSVALAIVDLLRFSDLNNTLGEHVGDQALRAIAARLRSAVENGHVARVGGDKFALYVPMIDGLHPLADLLGEDGLLAFAEPFDVAGHVVPIAARAGCAVFPADGASPEELFRNAETALSNAKASASGYSFYAPDFNVRLARKLELEARLRRALDEHQFVLYYQPKVCVARRELAGFEALLRWHDPERGLVPPNEFVPLMERNGMIVPAGRWVLEEAARQYDAWQRAGLRPPRIAVNLSAVQLHHPRLVDHVREAIGRYRHDCGLDLEVTESMLLENSAAAINTLEALRALGPELSLDDFGTGYSSLSYLQRLPLNALKVDRSFISGMVGDRRKMTIVSTIVSLGRALNLTVIAEGVESESEAAFLRSLQCDQFQGYLFSRPLPAEEASRFLRDASRRGQPAPA
jgi:diguanylate cyclase (GGDEF)-like protein